MDYILYNTITNICVILFTHSNKKVFLSVGFNRAFSRLIFSHQHFDFFPWLQVIKGIENHRLS